MDADTAEIAVERVIAAVLDGAPTLGPEIAAFDLLHLVDLGLCMPMEVDDRE
ncbi:hypothetical protein [Occultella kanbiaonis]|uniref:hypothetical protein n=1 Tax=Occultella kanbiaonis TaxID=2675754 RepID=UPI0012B7672E|nr:hypothetical protein [Occultella kanbiaonis]